MFQTPIFGLHRFRTEIVEGKGIDIHLDHHFLGDTGDPV